MPVGGRPLYQARGQYPHIEVRKWPYKKQQVQPKAGGGGQDGPSDQEVKQESSKRRGLRPLEEEPHPSVSADSPLPCPAVRGDPAWRRRIGETVTAAPAPPPGRRPLLPKPSAPTPDRKGREP